MYMIQIDINYNVIGKKNIKNKKCFCLSLPLERPTPTKPVHPNIFIVTFHCHLTSNMYQTDALFDVMKNGTKIKGYEITGEQKAKT